MGKEERKERERQVQRRRRRKQIMTAAKKVFSSKGFAGATIEDIAREAELASGTIYLYFSSKDELYAGINVELQKFMQRQVKKLAENEALTASEKVRELSKVLYQVYEFDPLMMRNVLHLQASDSLQNLTPETVETINGILAQTLSPLSSIVNEGIRHGLFQRHHPTALVDIVWATFSGLVLWEESKKLFDPRKDHLKSTLELAMEIFCRGIMVDHPIAKEHSTVGRKKLAATTS